MLLLVRVRTGTHGGSIPVTARAIIATMSRLWGEVRQLGFVVRDLDAAVRYWTQHLGVGPFFRADELQPVDYRFRGKAAPPPVMSLALANSGGLQLELIQQHNDAPSGYLELLAAGREGLHHVCAWATPDEYDARRAAMIDAGMVAVHEGRIPGRDVRFVYFATDEPGGLQFELADQRRPGAYEVQQRIATAAVGWDGSNPIRKISDLVD